MVSGGRLNGQTGKVHQYEVDGSFTALPDLNTAREYHGCSSYVNGNNKVELKKLELKALAI